MTIASFRQVGGAFSGVVSSLVVPATLTATFHSKTSHIDSECMARSNSLAHVVKRLFLSALLFVFSAVVVPRADAAIRVEAPDAVRALLERYLILPDSGATLDETARLSLERRLRKEAAELLSTEGYFSPQIDLRTNVGSSELIVQVETGTQAHIGEISLEIRGAISAEQRQQLIEQWRLPTRAIFRQAAWDAAKQGVLRELLDTDHAGARLLSSEAEVDAAAARVDLRLVYDAGPRYRYGEIRIQGLSRYKTDLVERYTRQLRVGASYRQDDLLAVQSALQNSPYFSSVRVELDRGDKSYDDRDSTAIVQRGEEDGALLNEGPATASDMLAEVVDAPVIIRVSERAPYEVTLGTGVSSNTGARVEANYRSADFLGRAWELHTGARVEQLSQSAYADVFFPPGRGQRRDSVGAVIEKTDIQGLATERIAFAASRVQPRGSVEQRIGLSWQYEKQLPNDAAATINRALTPSIGWLWRHSSNPLDAGEGIVAQLQLGASSKMLLSDQNFLRTYFRYSQGISLISGNSLLLRGEVGVTAAPSRQGIPQNELFRAGGTNSVRGYRYQGLGVKEGSATLGGRYLITLSAEYTRWLDDQWGVAAFVDAGQAADSRDVLNLAVGYGVGARWKSPAGPLAIDLAWGQDDKALRMHFSLAIPF